jgi:hypothetical protein
VVQPEHHERVGVGEDPLVDGKPETCLVDALEDGDRMAGRFPRDSLEGERRAVKSSSVPAIPCRN